MNVLRDGDRCSIIPECPREAPVGDLLALCTEATELEHEGCIPGCPLSPQGTRDMTTPSGVSHPRGTPAAWGEGGNPSGNFHQPHADSPVPVCRGCRGQPRPAAQCPACPLCCPHARALHEPGTVGSCMSMGKSPQHCRLARTPCTRSESRGGTVCPVPEVLQVCGQTDGQTDGRRGQNGCRTPVLMLGAREAGLGVSAALVHPARQNTALVVCSFCFIP